MKLLQKHHTTRREPMQRGSSDLTDVLKPYHKLAGLRLTRVNDSKITLSDPWGQIVATFNANYLSPHPIWAAADREIVRGRLSG